MCRVLRSLDEVVSDRGLASHKYTCSEMYFVYSRFAPYTKTPEVRALLLFIYKILVSDRGLEPLTFRGSSGRSTN
jgi:hypothetical protein